MIAVILITILVTVIATMIVNEVSDFSPYLATRLVRWSAKQAFPGDPERAKDRAEELEADVRAIPGKLTKLVFGLTFGTAGMYKWTGRNLESGPWWLQAILTAFAIPLVFLWIGFSFVFSLLIIGTALMFEFVLLKTNTALGVGFVAAIWVPIAVVWIRRKMLEMRRPEAADAAEPGVPSIGN